MVALTDRNDPHYRPIVDRTRRIIVVVDDSPESVIAVRWGAARAAHVEGGRLDLVYMIPPTEFGHWMAIEDKMREEAVEAAEALLQRKAEQVYDYCGHHPSMVIRHGEPIEQLLAYMDEVKDELFALVLGASVEENPGPLSTYFSSRAGTLGCIVVLVPGSLTEEDVDKMA